MKNLTFFIGVILLLALLSAGCSKTIRYSFYDDYVYTEALYSNSSAATARIELAGFVGRAEGNRELARKERRLNYSLVVGEAWLRLAAINKALGNTENYEYGIIRAVRHFDTISRFVSDSEYQANKSEMLISFLKKMEEEAPPRWRRELNEPAGQP